GSAISYARRYALAAIVGIVQTDDDGESAMDRGPQGKGMVEDGNGVQKEGPRVPGLSAEATKSLGFNPSGKLIEDLHRDETHKLIAYLENKYGEKMPLKTG